MPSLRTSLRGLEMELRTPHPPHPFVVLTFHTLDIVDISNSNSVIETLTTLEFCMCCFSNLCYSCVVIYGAFGCVVDCVAGGVFVSVFEGV